MAHRPVGWLPLFILGALLASPGAAQSAAGSGPWIQGYPDRLSCRPGETIAFHVSARVAAYDLEIARVGLERRVLWRKEGVPGTEHTIPANASSHGCGWPASLTLPVPAEWRSGFYEVATSAADPAQPGKRVQGDAFFFVVRPAEPGRDTKILLPMATNTANAYNNWGGYSLYAFQGRDGVQGRRVSFQRPIPTGFAHQWEVPFIRWAERAGYRIDYAANGDLERHPGILDSYRLVLSVGHDEYWSSPMRDALEAFIARGGHAAFLSGNVCCWQVRFEDEGRAMTCWKQAFAGDPLMAAGPHRLLSTLWSHHLVGRPENTLTGVGFLYGGYHRSHGQFMDGSGAFTVHRAGHWLFDGTGLKDGDAFGGAHTIVGYECDGCQFTIVDGKPVPTGSDGTPEGFSILATAPARWHPDDCEWYERWEKGRTGAACLGTWTSPGGGVVVTAGTTDWAHGLAGGDPIVDRVTRNLLDRLGGGTRAMAPDLAAKCPAESLALMEPREGFIVELAAAEPEVMDPIAFDFGPDGRLWVVEMADYPLGLDGRGKPGGRVRFLEDRDGDGRYEQSTLFLDGIPFPTDVMAWREGVLVTAAPDVFFAADDDGDGRADRKDVLFTGFGEGNQQHRVNGLRFGLDNWVHLANGDSGGEVRSLKTGKRVDLRGRDLRIRPDTGELDLTTGQSQYGRSPDDWGRWFGGNNHEPVFHYAIEDRYLRRNPFLTATGRVVVLANEDAPLFPIGPVVSHWSGYKPPPPGQPARFTSACGVMVYRDDLFGPEFEGNVFLCEPVHNLVHRRILDPRGATMTSRRPDDEQRSEFLASRDPWFRPTTVRTGPDGALWIADMVRFVIEHPEWIDDEAERFLDLRAGHDKGRIWRVVPKGRKPRPIPRLDGLDTAGLVAALDSPSGWQRDLAHRMLLWRDDRSAVELLGRMARECGRAQARLHALCVLDGLDALSPETVIRALDDPHPGVRCHAVRLLERFSGGSARVFHALAALLGDHRPAEGNPQVLLQLACTVGEWDDEKAATAAGVFLAERAGDPLLRAAALSSASKRLDQAVTSVLLLRRMTGGNEKALMEDLVRTAAGARDHAALKRLLDASLPSPEETLAAWNLAVIGGVLEAVDAGAYPDPGPKLDRPLAAARGLAADVAAEPARRAAAAALLGRRPAAVVEDIGVLADLISGAPPGEVQSAAFAALGRIRDDRVAGVLVERWPSWTAERRVEILALLVRRRAGVEALLDAVAAGRIAVPEIGATHRQLLLEHPDAALRSRAAAVLGESAAASRQEVIDRWLPAVVAAAAAADPQRGVAVFIQHCAPCHRVGGIGYGAGPDLAALADRSAGYMVPHVLDPDRAVEDRYLNHSLTTKDGDRYDGLLTHETEDSVTLMGLSGGATVIRRTDIEPGTFERSRRSMMPSGFEACLTPKDLADLIAFVGANLPAPKRCEGNRPALVRAGEGGALVLSARNAEIYGPSLVFEPAFGNLGWWQSEDDLAVWSLQVPEAGDYEVAVEWALPPDFAGQRWVLRAGEARLSGTAASTGSWEGYREAPAGRLRLEAGLQRLSFRSAGPLRGPLLDLRALRLAPAAQHR